MPSRWPWGSRQSGWLRRLCCQRPEEGCWSSPRIKIMMLIIMTMMMILTIMIQKLWTPRFVINSNFLVIMMLMMILMIVRKSITLVRLSDQSDSGLKTDILDPALPSSLQGSKMTQDWIQHCSRLLCVSNSLLHEPEMDLQVAVVSHIRIQIWKNTDISPKYLHCTNISKKVPNMYHKIFANICKNHQIWGSICKYHQIWGNIWKYHQI